MNAETAHRPAGASAAPRIFPGAARTWGLLLPAALALLAAACDDGPGPRPNRPPEIREVVLFPETVILGGETRVTALASDPDGDRVTYAWRAASGSLSSRDASSTFWTAPDTAGAYSIHVEVGDGQETVGDSVVVLVGEGSVTVLSDPPGADAALDGSLTTFKTPHTFDRVSIGGHGIQLTSPDFRYDRASVSFELGHARAETVRFVTEPARVEVLNLGRDDVEEIGGLTYLPSGKGILFAGRTTLEGVGIYTTRLAAQTGQANSIFLTGETSIDEAPAVSHDGRWMIFTTSRGELAAVRIYDNNDDGLVDSLGTGANLLASRGYGADISVEGWVAYSNEPSPASPEAPLTWAAFQEGSLGALSFVSLGRRPAWSPSGVRLAYQQDGRIVYRFIDEFSSSPQDTLATDPEGFVQMPAWSPYASNAIAYVFGASEANATEVRLQVPGKDPWVTLTTALFDPRDLAWSPTQRVLAVSHNPGRGQVLLVVDLPIP